MVRFLLLVASVMLVVLPVSAQALWGGLTVGMTPEQVRGARSGLIDVSDPRALIRDASGVSPALLREPGVDVGGLRFDATMYFREGRLDQVALSNDKTNPIADPVAAYEGVVEALTSKYGKASSAERSSSLGYSANHTWLVGDITIKSVVFDFRQGQPLINVNYSRRAADRAKNL